MYIPASFIGQDTRFSSVGAGFDSPCRKMFLFVFVLFRLAATPTCAPGPQEASRSVFSAIQRYSTKYINFNFAINFGSELIDVRSGTSTLRLYSFQPRNYEEKLEKPKFLLISTSNKKIRPSFKMKEATLMFSTSNGAWPKNQKITKIIFRKISKKRKRPTKKHKERRYTCSKSRIFDLFCLTSFVAKVLQYSKNLALLIRHFFNFTIYNKLFFVRLFLALLIVLSIN